MALLEARFWSIAAARSVLLWRPPGAVRRPSARAAAARSRCVPPHPRVVAARNLNRARARCAVPASGGCGPLPPSALCAPGRPRRPRPGGSAFAGCVSVVPAPPLPPGPPPPAAGPPLVGLWLCVSGCSGRGGAPGRASGRLRRPGRGPGAGFGALPRRRSVYSGSLLHRDRRFRSRLLSFRSRSTSAIA